MGCADGENKARPVVIYSVSLRSRTVFRSFFGQIRSGLWSDKIGRIHPDLGVVGKRAATPGGAAALV